MKDWRSKMVHIMTMLKSKEWVHLSEIYHYVEENFSDLPVTFEGSVRWTLQDNSSDSKNYNGKRDLFEMKEKGSGYWRLRDVTKAT
tara:strand:+ start:1428 stop:1685 length:258 start_codon:yes stop_codon:yes gene_type:complete